MSFNSNFVWGAATAAYQIEGAASEDGKGLSVWDMCAHIPGFVKGNHTGDHACNHYYRYKEDVQLMKEIGLQAYRLSISWPRVLPDGTGRINEKGLDFYDRLIDELLENGITPYVTLFHWDYPHELFKKGGWLNPDSSDWFVEYTRVIADRLSDRVTNWFTQNEPQCYIGLGHSNGTHAPGLKLGQAEVLQATHNSLLAHGKAVQTLRQYSKQPCQIGYAPVGITSFPETETPENIEAARRHTFSITEPTFWMNTWYMDPVFLGHYPEDGLKVFEPWLPTIKPGDMETINQPLDFLGLNIYHGTPVKMGADSKPQLIGNHVGYPQTSMRWTVTPESLYWGPKFFYERYGAPIVITENGMANLDWVNLDKQVHDPQRIDYMHRYLQEYRRAATDGVDVKGYFYWSFMDNFEWAEGYNERFGLVHTDYRDGKRTIKDSGYWYRSVIQSNGESL
ncbi:GH1 family beta-glucosidase [Paenibacillus sp. FSL K6-2524]|uniref:GH1 family beta-glucosidase n=1 Tax=Paenibacillus sp. FSL K6-2524 TaxID=2954516 RepID=UPI0030F4BC8A